MIKSDLRKKYKALRQELTHSEIEDLSLSIANQALKLPIWDHSYYHLFLSISNHHEVNTEHLLNILAGKDKHVLISKSDFQTQNMEHYLLTDSTRIKINSWGIPEPIDGIVVEDSKIDVVFVPLLAFDKSGQRVGYGKGFYDKFLANCRPQSIKIGLSFFYPEDFIEDCHEYDIRLNYCLTPEKIYDYQLI